MGTAAVVFDPEDQRGEDSIGPVDEGEPFLGRERIFAQKVLDPAKSARACSDRIDESGCPRIDAPFGFGRAWRLRKQALGNFLVGRGIGRHETRDVGVLGCRVTP